MIELYIENRLIELEQELEIEFTYETIDPNKLASIKNSFSKTVSIPGTANNNITFGHIFRNDKYIPINIPGNPIESFYDPHRRVTWLINKNGSIVQRGYCTLDSIDVNNDQKITYKLTLYGGIGEFFYSLSYNEDGSNKTLKDIYYNWRPKTQQIGYDNALNIGEEMTNTLMVCSPYIITRAYHNLDPNYTYEGTTDIDKDVVFVPCYVGLYDDFDSNHMLVSTFNQNYMNAPLSTTTRQKLRDVFKDSIIEDDIAFTTLDSSFSSLGAYRYGLATFSRDLEPSETGDFRINELPVAIRLSKLLWAITRPENCNGYEVEWSQSILNSLQFLYGWVLLGKLKSTKEKVEKIIFKSYVPNNTTIHYKQDDQGQNSSSSGSSDILYNSTLDSGSYNFNLTIKPKLSFETRYISQSINFEEDIWSTSALWMRVSGTNVNIWTRYNTYIIIHKFISDSSTIAVIADVFFYSTSLNEYFGQDPYHTTEEYIEALKSSLEYYLQNDITKITIHNCIPNITNNIYDPSDGTYGRRSISAQSNNETILFTFDHIGTNFRIEQQSLLSFIQWGSQTNPIVGVWGIDNPYNSGCPRNLSFFGSTYSSYRTKWYFRDELEDYSFSFDFIDGGLFLKDSIGFNILNLNKQTLFATTESPFKYLTDYCKLMNYKFICDNIHKKITILESNEYYKDSSIDINNKVDYSRVMNINPVIAKNKLIYIGLNPIDTYPIELIERNLDNKFGIKKYDTNLEYSSTNTTLLDNLIYKSSVDWQLNSIFYHIHPQFPRAYNTPTLSWTLFNFNDGELNKKEFIIQSNEANNINLSETYDKSPRLALFDKSQKYTQGTTLLFLNGFVKNYDYITFTDSSSEVGDIQYAIAPQSMFSVDTLEQYYLNEGKRCYVYDFKYNDNFLSWGCYSSDQKGVATSWTLPFFTRDLYNKYIYRDDTQQYEWRNYPYKLASWNMYDQNGIDNVYSLSSTSFIKTPSFNYEKTTNSTDFLGNEYIIETISIPQDLQDVTSRPYDKWARQLNDIYDRNAREVTLYVDLSQMSDSNEILRQTYLFESSKWIITKIHNFNISNFMKDKFTKVTLKKIINTSAWIR